MSQDNPNFQSLFGSQPTDHPTPSNDLYSEQLAQKEARSKALQDPEIRLFLGTLPYPQAAEIIPGMRKPDGTYITTLAEVKDMWATMEPSFRHMHGGPAAPKPKSSEYQQRLQLWSQQRQEREAERNMRNMEREQRKAQKEALLADMEVARSTWKEAVQRKKVLVAQLDEEIRELHDAFSSLKQRYDLL